MDLQWLLTFDKIVQTGSFTQAGKELGFTQSTVTFQIRQLENELSVKLFDQIGRKKVLSDAGRAIIPDVHQVIRCMNHMKYSDCRNNIISGYLKIGISGGIMESTGLFGAIQEIISHPQVKLEIYNYNCIGVLKALKNAAIDVGILFHSAAENDPVIKYISLIKTPLMLLTSKQPLHGVSDFFMDTPLYFSDSECVFYQSYRKYVTTHDRHFQEKINMGNWSTIINSVKAGLGITIAPAILAKAEIQQGKIFAYPLESLGEDISVDIAIHKNKWVSPALNLFINSAAEHCTSNCFIDDFNS